MAKIRDIGIVLFPDRECKKYTNNLISKTAEILPNHQQAKNHIHVTLFHVANVAIADQETLITTFDDFARKNSYYDIKLPVKAINATGGSESEGYKWLDLQLGTSPSLQKLRTDVIDTFSPFHNGRLERMNDDYASFSPHKYLKLKNTE